MNSRVAISMRDALEALRKHDLDDGPCWCSVEPNALNGHRHERHCRDAKAALAADDDLGPSNTAGGHEHWDDR